MEEQPNTQPGPGPVPNQALPATAPPSAPLQVEFDAGHVPMTEEMDSNRRLLPPIVPVAAGLVVIAIIVGIYVGAGKAVARPSGKWISTFALDQSSQSDVNGKDDRVMVVMQVEITNPDQKPLYVQAIRAELHGDAPEPLQDDAAAAIDIARYAAAFPELKDHLTEPLKLETKVDPGKTVSGTVVVGFPVNKDTFDKRKGLHVIVKPYDLQAIDISER